MSAATQNEMERLRKERDLARRDYEVINRIREGVDKDLEAALDREQALAAHVKKAQRLADSDRVDDEFYDEDGDLRTGSGWKSKLGRDLHAALNGADTSCLARRDLIKQAEALEAVKDELINSVGRRQRVAEDILTSHIYKLHQQAEDS